MTADQGFNSKAVRITLIRCGVILLLSVPGPVNARANDFGGMEVVDVPLVAWVAAREHALPNTLANFAQTGERSRKFRGFVELLSAHNWTKAREAAIAMSYMVVAIKDADTWFVVASDDSKTGRDPILVVTSAPERDIILEAPHVPFEAGTGEQVVTLLRDLRGKAALVSGAHRCASRTYSSCDGKTAVCGTSEGYRDSDAGHNTGSLFNQAHIVFSEKWANALVVSLHGMKEDESGGGVQMIISNGAHDRDINSVAAATKLRLALASKSKSPGMIVNCNYPPDDLVNYRKLCGYTNVQGRHVNGGLDACHASVDSGTGRFIHIEQDWHVLRPYSQNWSRLYENDWPKAILQSFGAVISEIH
jgi:hypothetical protein